MIGPTDLLHPSPAPHFKTFQVFLICCPKRPCFSTIQSNYFVHQLVNKTLMLLVCHLYIIDLISAEKVNILKYRMMTKGVEQVT
jgi:hypothetical protein